METTEILSSTTELKDFLAIHCALQPPFDFLVELPLDQQLVQLVAHDRQWWYFLVRSRDLVYQELLVSSFNLVHIDRDSRAEPLLHKSVDGGHSEHELVEVGCLETLLFEFSQQPRLSAAPFNQHFASPLGIELEAKEKAPVLDVAEFDLESNTGGEKSRAVGLFGLVWFLVNQADQGGQFEIAEEDRCASNDRENFLDCLPLLIGGGAEMTGSQEDESEKGGPHPGIIAACAQTRAPCGSWRHR